MGLWAGIKYALNSTLGTEEFLPLDKMVARGNHNVFDALYENETETIEAVVLNRQYSASSKTKIAEITVPSDINIVRTLKISIRSTSSSYDAAIGIAPSGTPSTDVSGTLFTKEISFKENTIHLGYGFLIGGMTYDVYLWASSSNTAYVNKITLVGETNIEGKYKQKGVVKSVQYGYTYVSSQSSTKVNISSVNLDKAMLITNATGQPTSYAYLQNANTLYFYTNSNIGIGWQVVEFY